VDVGAGRGPGDAEARVAIAPADEVDALVKRGQWIYRAIEGRRARARAGRGASVA